MINTGAPAIRGDYPESQPPLGPAWAAGWTVLIATPDRWHRSTTLSRAMAAHGPTTPKAAAELLRHARRAGLLDVSYETVGKPPRRTAHYRVRPLGTVVDLDTIETQQ